MSLTATRLVRSHVESEAELPFAGLHALAALGVTRLAARLSARVAMSA